MSQADVRLAGVLPLVLSRTHVSSYRVGRWFGPSWASTVDQRLEVDGEGVCFAAEDGMLLYYPTPGGDGRAVLPAEGPRWPLVATLYGYEISDPVQGRVWRFTRPGDESRPGVRMWPLSTITDRNGNRIDLDYDEVGVLTGVRHSGGYRIRVEGAGGRITALHLVDAGGGEQVLMRYGYDDSRQLTEVYNATGEPMVFDYDPAGRMISWTDRIGGWYRYDYDSAGRCVRTTGADGMLECRIAYDPQARTTTVTDSLGQVRSYQLNSARQVVQETDPLGRVTTQQWDRYDRLLSRTDPLGRTTTYTYDDDGNLTALTRPDGTRTTATYNHLRLPVTITDPDGATRRFEYDQHGNLAVVTDANGATTRYGFNQHGHLVMFVNPENSAYEVHVDARGLPIKITDPAGASTQYDRDWLGRTVAITDPVGGITRMAWSTEGDMISRTLPDGAAERWRYDAEGNLVGYRDPMGNTTKFEIGPFASTAARTDPDGTRLTFDYDTELRLVAVTNPQGLVWRYEYDPAGQLVSETDFNGHTVEYRYDAAGQLTSRTNGAGETIHYTRDLAGRIVEQDSTHGGATFAYDSVGRLVRARNSDAELTFAYDVMGRLTAEACNGAVVSYDFDLAGRRTRRTTPSGADAAWEYDARGRPARLHTAGHVLSFHHDAAGREIHRQLDAKLTLTHSWDAGHRMLAQTLTAQGPSSYEQPAGGPNLAPGSRPLLHRTWQYRPDGRLVGVEDATAGPRRFDLDANARVTAVHGDGWTERYAYDPAGNVTTATWPTTPGSDPIDGDAQGDRDYTGTLINRAGRVRYEHDLCGRVTLRQQKRLSGKPRTWRYTWNSEDQLKAVILPDGTTWRYSYDPLGRRIAKRRIRDDGEVIEQVQFVWDETNLAEQVRYRSIHSGAEEGRHTTVWEWEPGTFRPLTQFEYTSLRDAPQEVVDQRFYAIITDMPGTPTELATPDGEIAWRRWPTLWGTTQTTSTGGADCPLRFPGQYHDPETLTNYNFYRHYDPVTARYQSPDPLGLTPSPNPHSYVPNPTVQIDPLGLAPCTTPVRIKPGQQAPGDLRLSPAELQFVRDLAARKPNLQVYRTSPTAGQGDFLVIDRSNPRSWVGWVAELKSSSGAHAGHQLRNALDLTASRGGPFAALTRIEPISGTARQILNAMNRGRGAW